MLRRGTNSYKSRGWESSGSSRYRDVSILDDGPRTATLRSEGTVPAPHKTWRREQYEGGHRFHRIYNEGAIGIRRSIESSANPE